MNEVQAIWQQLAVPQDLSYTARVLPAEDRLWLALDREGQQHLLVALDAGTPGYTLLRVRGLSAVVTALAVEGSPATLWIDIHCEDPRFNGTFATVANDIVTALGLSKNTLPTVEEALLAWRWFWGSTRGLSEEAALGLFGELWFLERWIEAADPRVWLGPTGHRHDFAAPELSVEVKATRVRRDGSSQHRITHLDQLADPEQGKLLLFSLQAVPDPNAANSLPHLIQRLEQRYSNSVSRLETLRQRLGQAGWSSATSDVVTTTYRVTAEELYRVEDGFPRLTRASFIDGPPPGVDDISYTLDLAACSPWRIATTPDAGAPSLAALLP